MNLVRWIQVLILTALTLAFLGPGSAASTFGSGNSEPLPNVTSVEVYDVTGLSSSQKETGGELVDSGLNTTLTLNQTESWRLYRTEFSISNDGDQDWQLSSSDNLTHQGLNSSWVLEKVWYNISQDYDTGTYSSGKVEWNTSKGGNLPAGEVLHAKHIINVSAGSSASYSPEFLVNDSSESAGSQDRHRLDINRLGWLNVSLVTPPNDTVVTQNRTFRLNASVVCDGGECGEVEVSPRYNASSREPDTVIPSSEQEPLYVNSSSTRTCSSSLLKGERCYVSWYVNATGDLRSYHRIDALASSSYSSVDNNDSENSLIQINRALLIDFSWSTTSFGNLDPGERDVPAEGNSKMAYNLTVTQDSEPVDSLWIKSTDLDSLQDSYSIPAENMSYSTSNDITSEDFFSKSYELVKKDIDPGEVVNFFFWLDVPTGKAEGDYNGTYFFKVNSTI
ncbi:MAG: hypothetical protein ABEJ03_03335 [Candidatus Nanohaloarchaea archaeon]